MKINNEKGWLCPCGNTSGIDGFYPCNSEGEQVEPTREAWDGITWVCERCGRIINDDTLEIVGVAWVNKLTEEEKKEIMEVEHE
jgi:Zn-finger protein